MKCIKYQITVCDGTMDFVHGSGRIISEIYNKNCNIFFNEDGHVFTLDNPEERFKGLETEEVDVSELYLDYFENYLGIKRKIETYIKDVFKERDE